MSQKIVKLEALRGFVAIYVTCAHVFFDKFMDINGYNLSFIWDFGDLGVMIFFILSGFVIHYSFSRSNDKSFKKYFCKRFFRIYIPLIVVFITNFIILKSQDHYLASFSWKSLVINLLMLQNIDQPFSNFNPLFNNGPLWSLSYEWWFYMIYFFVIKFLKNNASYFIYGLAIVSSVACLFYPFFIFRVFVFITLWWIGTDIAKLYLNPSKKISFYNLRFQLAAILLSILILNIKHVPYSVSSYMISGFFALITGLIWHQLHWKCFDKTIGRFASFAPISYGIYISHWFLIFQASYLDFIKNDVIRYSLYFAICFLFSYIVERIIYPKLNRFFMRNIKFAESKN